MSEVRFSIITCFHNSAHRLDHYFAALRALEVAGHGVEFLFVDNASRDATAERLPMEAARLSSPARVLTEPTPGLMSARCTGVAAAQGEFVLFLDDDNEPAPDYLVQLERLLAAHPAAAMITGNVVLPTGYPVDDGNRGALPLLVLRELPGEFVFALATLLSPHFPWGAGLFARREALVAACAEWSSGGRTITGRAGGRLSGGEDIWLAHFLTREGGRVVFSDQLRIVHRLDPTRLAAEYLGRLAFENGLESLKVAEGIAALKPAIHPPCLRPAHLAWTFCLRLPARLLRCWWRRDVTALTQATSALGYAYSLLTRLVR